MMETRQGPGAPDRAVLEKQVDAPGSLSASPPSAVHGGTVSTKTRQVIASPQPAALELWKTRESARRARMRRRLRDLLRSMRSRRSSSVPRRIRNVRHPPDPSGRLFLMTPPLSAVPASALCAALGLRRRPDPARDGGRAPSGSSRRNRHHGLGLVSPVGVLPGGPQQLRLIDTLVVADSQRYNYRVEWTQPAHAGRSTPTASRSTTAGGFGS